jgi:hypothetical protein
MAEQTITRDEMQARRELLECRTCGGFIWHFDVQEPPSAAGAVKRIGYRCAGCGARVQVSVPAEEHDGAPDDTDQPRSGPDPTR